MTVYNLFTNLTATQAAPGIAQSGGGPYSAINVPPGSQAVAPGGGAAAPVNPTSGQEFQLVVVGSGAVSASAQVFGSNDGINWVAYGSALSASSAQTVSSAAASGTALWNWYTAQLTAISGTGAQATLTMST